MLSLLIFNLFLSYLVTLIRKNIDYTWALNTTIIDIIGIPFSSFIFIIIVASLITQIIQITQSIHTEFRILNLFP